MDTELELFEKHILPNGQIVHYSDSVHTYIVGGREVPSITSLLPLLYGDTYKNVNPDTLKSAADYGTAVHKELQECIDRRMEVPSYQVNCETPEARNYFTFVEPIWNIKPIMTERIVVLYDPNGKPFAASRFDLLCEVDGRKTLADFKTTSTIHRQLVTAQLNLYRTAAIQSGYIGEDENVGLGAIHLKGSTAKFVPISVLSDNFYLQFLI